MEWCEYVNEILSVNTELDDIVIKTNHNKVMISPIIKASIMMLDNIYQTGNCNTAIVFPEIRELSKEYILADVIHSISSGKIEATYDPRTFEKGQKLRYLDCIVTFDGCDANEHNGVLKGRIWITFAGKDGMRLGIPMHLAPYFQKVESKKLSTYDNFYKKYSEHKARQEAEVAEKADLLSKLSNYKTHLNETIILVTEIKRAREFFTSTTLGGKKLTELFYIAHINGDGHISNISPGQMAGNPAIALATDLYAVINALKNVSIKRIVFDASTPGSIDRQIDAFDTINRSGTPIVCISDVINSFDNNLLILVRIAQISLYQT